MRPAAIVVYPAIYMLEFIENPGCKNDLLPDRQLSIYCNNGLLPVRPMSECLGKIQNCVSDSVTDRS